MTYEWGGGGVSSQKERVGGCVAYGGMKYHAEGRATEERDVFREKTNK